MQSNADAPHPEETLTTTVTLSTAEWQIRGNITVPRGLTSMFALLPVIQSLDEMVVGAAVQTAEDQGAQISCRKGCGACCRQLVPISKVETQRLGRLVDDMPEPRRSTIRARFADAVDRLDKAGLLAKLRGQVAFDSDELEQVGLQYFYQGIPCPFLEDEACSIHPDRPLSCREYLVTSPAEHCAHPSAELVRRVAMPLKVWTAVARCDAADPLGRLMAWGPLILALEWHEAHPEAPPARPGPELLSEFLDYLTAPPRDDEPSLEQPVGDASATPMSADSSEP